MYWKYIFIPVKNHELIPLPCDRGQFFIYLQENPVIVARGSLVDVCLSAAPGLSFTICAWFPLNIKIHLSFRILYPEIHVFLGEYCILLNDFIDFQG